MTTDRRQPALDLSPFGSASYSTFDLETTVYAAPVVLEGVVTAVRGPFWNAEDGQRWEPIQGRLPPDGGDYTVPVLYREVDVRLQTLLRNEYALEPDSTVTVFTLGSGKEGTSDPFVDGNLTVDDHVVLFLAEDIFFMRARPEIRNMPFNHRDGVFHITVNPDGTSVVVPDQAWVNYDELTPGEAANAAVPYEEFLTIIADSRLKEDPELEPYRPSPADTSARLSAIENFIETGK